MRHQAGISGFPGDWFNLHRLSSFLLWLTTGFVLAVLPLLSVLRFPLHPLSLGFSTVAVMAAAALILLRPGWGACALILVIYWNASDVVNDTWGFGWLLRLSILWTAVSWGWQWLRSLKPAHWRWPVIAPLAAYGGVQALASFGAGNMFAAWTAMFEFVKAFAVFYLVANLLPTPRAWRRGINTIVVSVMLLGAPVIYQGITGSHFEFWGFGAMKYAEIVPGEWGWRLGGAMGDPNFLAMVLVAAVPLAVVQALSPDVGIWRRGICIAGASMALAATLFTYSRASALAVAFLAITMGWKYRKQKKMLGAGAAILLAAVWPLLPPGLLARVLTLKQASLTAQQQAIADSSIRVRRTEWFAGWLMFERHPILGVGPGNYEYEYQQYAAWSGLNTETTMRDPHSLFMQIAAETGLSGLIAFASLLTLSLRLMESGRARLQCLGAFHFADLIWSLEISMAAYLLLSMFLHGAYFRHFLLLLALGSLGAKLALSSTKDCEDAWLPSRTLDYR